MEDRFSQVCVALAAKEREALDVIKEDLCQWLTNVLQSVIASPTFMDSLETGILLCKLAEMIQQLASRLKSKGSHKGLKFQVPMEPLSCNYNAGPGILGAFHSRVNTSNFISWCRKLGVKETVIFESEGLVLHKDEKRVILCLLDVARFAERVGLPPPQLVRMEREIEQLEKGGGNKPCESMVSDEPMIVKPQEARAPMLMHSAIPLGDTCKTEDNGAVNFTQNKETSCVQFASRIPVKSSKSSIKYRKSFQLNGLSQSWGSEKRWRWEGIRGVVEKEEMNGKVGGEESVGKPGKHRMGRQGSARSRRSWGGWEQEKREKIKSKGTVDERVMKRMEECTCQNKIEVVGLGNGKFTVRGASGRIMTVYARVSYHLRSYCPSV